MFSQRAMSLPGFSAALPILLCWPTGLLHVLAETSVGESHDAFNGGGFTESMEDTFIESDAPGDGGDRNSSHIQKKCPLPKGAQEKGIYLQGTVTVLSKWDVKFWVQHMQNGLPIDRYSRSGPTPCEFYEAVEQLMQQLYSRYSEKGMGVHQIEKMVASLNKTSSSGYYFRVGAGCGYGGAAGIITCGPNAVPLPSWYKNVLAHENFHGWQWETFTGPQWRAEQAHWQEMFLSFTNLAREVYWARKQDPARFAYYDHLKYGLQNEIEWGAEVFSEWLWGSGVGIREGANWRFIEEQLPSYRRFFECLLTGNTRGVLPCMGEIQHGVKPPQTFPSKHLPVVHGFSAEEQRAIWKICLSESDCNSDSNTNTFDGVVRRACPKLPGSPSGSYRLGYGDCNHDGYLDWLCWYTGRGPSGVGNGRYLWNPQNTEGTWTFVVSGRPGDNWTWYQRDPYNPQWRSLLQPPMREWQSDHGSCNGAKTARPDWLKSWTPPKPPTPTAAPGAATGWRISATSTALTHGWAWDVIRLKLLSSAGELLPSSGCVVTDSGNPGRGWGPEGVFQANGAWGGRADCSGTFFVGLKCSSPHQIVAVQIMQGSGHRASTIEVQKQVNSNEDWVTVHTANSTAVTKGLETIWTLSATSTTTTATATTTTTTPTTTSAAATTTTSTTSTASDNSIQAGDTIFLKSRSGTGNYIDIEGSTVRARWSTQGDWQAITIETKTKTKSVLHSGDIIYLKTHTGAFIDVVDGVVQARWADTGAWQAMKIVKRTGSSGSAILADDVICLQSHTGKHLDVAKGWNGVTVVRARWNDCGDWQSMRIKKEPVGALQSGDSISLLTHTGNRMEVEGDVVRARWAEAGAWQTFSILNYAGRTIFSGDTVFLKAHTGALVHVQDTMVLAKWNDHGAWQSFTLLKKNGDGSAVMPGEAIFLRAHTGKYIDVQGNAVQARWSEMGTWQSLIVEKSGMGKRRLTEVSQKDLAADVGNKREEHSNVFLV